MSRVERIDNPNQQRRSESPREVQRRSRDQRSQPSAGTTPGKAEGTVDDVEEALKHQKE
jgi:hypothetical protein